MNERKNVFNQLATILINIGMLDKIRKFELVFSNIHFLKSSNQMLQINKYLYYSDMNTQISNKLLLIPFKQIDSNFKF